MRLIKRLIELAFVILIISLFMKNKDIELSINYFGLKEPIKLAFWELVTLCVSVGIIIAALGDFITQLKWVRERRRMVKTDREHQGDVARLNEKISDLESHVQRIQKELDQKNARIAELEKDPPQIESGATSSLPSDT
jgi:uncharacterized membrane protein YciS (DUF1049 family)